MFALNRTLNQISPVGINKHDILIFGKKAMEIYMTGPGGKRIHEGNIHD